MPYPGLFVFQVSKQFEFNLVTEENGKYCFQKGVAGEVKELFDIAEKLNQDSSFKWAMLIFVKTWKKSETEIFRF